MVLKTNKQMSLDEFLEKFATPQEEQKPIDPTEAKRKRLREVLRDQYLIAAKVVNGDIYVYSDGVVGLALEHGKIKELTSYNWDFEDTMFSIRTNKVEFKVEAVVEVVKDDEVVVENTTFEFSYKLPQAHCNTVEQLFDTGIKEITYNDKQGSRDRQKTLVIYSKNRAYRFDGGPIPNICSITKSDYDKNGKWSNTTYQLVINRGYKVSYLMQSWGLGHYVSLDADTSEPDYATLSTLKESFGLTELNDEEFILFIKNKFPIEYKEYSLVERF